MHKPDPGSMVDDSMPELRREAAALGADAVALAETSAGVARISDWDGIWGSEPTRSKLRKG